MYNIHTYNGIYFPGVYFFKEKKVNEPTVIGHKAHINILYNEKTELKKTKIFIPQKVPHEKIKNIFAVNFKAYVQHIHICIYI